MTTLKKISLIFKAQTFLFRVLEKGISIARSFCLSLVDPLGLVQDAGYGKAYWTRNRCITQTLEDNLELLVLDFSLECTQFITEDRSRSGVERAEIRLGTGTASSYTG